MNTHLVNRDSQNNKNVVLTDHFRPLYHFTAPKNWLNDPNGMVYYDGEYHLFYQYHPFSAEWGPMHWGHAISTDLVNWQHLPIAMHPDELGYIYSGCTIIDWHNTAGFGKEAMLGFFTHHNPENSNQSQSIAYSLDKGRTWTKYDKNPILPVIPESRDFRDPKVFWYEKGRDVAHWVMLVASGDAILFYTSTNLLTWQRVSEFGRGFGVFSGVWETPDLFELPIEGSDETRWVLTLGIGAGAPVHEIRMQYFVGQFDGFKFTSENDKKQVLWADFGADFYAAQSWNGVPDPSRRIWLAWMSNWTYAIKTPPQTWRGAMSMPRQLSLRCMSDGIRLVQNPVHELQQLRHSETSWHNIALSRAEPFAPSVDGELFEIVAEFELGQGATLFGIRVQVGEEGATAVGYDPVSQTVFIDRTRSGQVNFHPEFPGVHRAPFTPESDTVRFHLFVDRSVIELFVDDGILAFGERVFPNQGHHGIELYCESGTVILRKLCIYRLRAANFSLSQSESES